MQSVAVTGAAGDVGRRLVERLLLDSRMRLVVAIDRQESDFSPTDRLAFFRVDLRHPLVFDIFSAHGVQAVVHLAPLATTRPDGGFESAHSSDATQETIKLLAAAALADIRQIIIVSPAMVYGADPGGPLYRREAPLTNLRDDHSRTDRRIRGSLEIEGICDNFIHRYPRIKVSILRLAPVLDTPLDLRLTAILSHSVALTVFGFDPLVQLLHHDDLIQAIISSLEREVSGIYHLAADGIIPLHRMLHLAGCLPLPLAGIMAELTLDSLWKLKLSPAPPEILQFFRYSCLLNTDKAKQELGFLPGHTSEQVLAAWLRLKKKPRGFDDPMNFESPFEDDSPGPEPLIDTLQRGLLRLTGRDSGRKI